MTRDVRPCLRTAHAVHGRGVSKAIVRAPGPPAAHEPLQANRDASGEFVGLVASARLHADPDRVAELLASGRLAWLEAHSAGPVTDGLRRYSADLRLRIDVGPAGVTTFRKAAFVDLGSPSRVSGGWEMEISWRAASAAPLFPVFAGRLVIEPAELRIEGLYAPPGGRIGRVADRALLHLAARATARWLLAEIDRAALGAAG
jgi:hypothetical protein